MTNSPMSRLSAETEASAYAGIRRQAQIDALRRVLGRKPRKWLYVQQTLARLEAGGTLEEESDGRRRTEANGFRLLG